MVQQAIDLSTTDTTGNSAMIAIRHPEIPSGTLLVETLHLVDCIAPAELGVDRFLPPRIVRDVVAPNLASVAANLPWDEFTEEQLDVDRTALYRLLDSQRDGLQKMIGAARERATEALTGLKAQASDKAATAYANEIDRLRALADVNPNVRPEEIEFLEAARDLTGDAIASADVRLDAIRVIVAG